MPQAHQCCLIPLSFINIIFPSACRHRFFEDVEALRAQERARNDAKKMEILERRQRQIEEVAEKKRGGSSWTVTDLTTLLRQNIMLSRCTDVYISYIYPVHSLIHLLNQGCLITWSWFHWWIYLNNPLSEVSSKVKSKIISTGDICRAWSRIMFG